MPPGVLYVVATPIGHLGDLTARAAEVLRTVPVVAAEDTRRTKGLLAHLGATPRLLSFHAHSKARRTSLLLRLLDEGSDVALVSDAGTPAISDPGADLVAAVRAAGGKIVPIPGPSAIAAAISIAGFPADRFLFLGFLPRKGKERERLLRLATESEWPVVLYEGPPRLLGLLEDLTRVAGADRRVIVAREVTKIHEETWSSSLAEATARAEAQPPRGEVTIVLEGSGKDREPAITPPPVTEVAREFLAQGLTRREVVRRLVEEAGVSRNVAYRVVMELK